MPDKRNPFPVTAALLVLGAAAPAQAALPQGVRAMLEAARDSGDAQAMATVIQLAKQTNPDSMAEIELIAWSDPRLFRPGPMVAPSPEVVPVAFAAAPPEAIWDGEGELGGFLTTGNSDSFGVSGGLKVERTRGNWKHGISARADYQKTNDEVTREFYQVGYKGDWTVSPRAYAFGLAQFESDRLAGYVERYSLGSGLGFQLVKRDDLSVKLEGGPALRSTDLTDGRSELAVSGRGAIGVDWRMKAGLRAKQDASIYSEAGATSIQSTTALDAKLIEKLTARLSYSLRYESRPLTGSVGTDTVTRASVVYDF